jgi:hypothetical protein
VTEIILTQYMNVKYVNQEGDVTFHTTEFVCNLFLIG